MIRIMRQDNKRTNPHKKTVKNFFIFLFLFAILLSCSDRSQSNNSKFYNFDHNGMLSDFEYLFAPVDTVSENLDKNSILPTLIIRFNDKCQIKKLPLSLEYSSMMADSIFKSEIEIPLFNDRGVIKGRGNFGIYEASIPLNLEINDPDGFYLTVSTPEKITEGILALGVMFNNSDTYESNTSQFQRRNK